MKIVGIIPARYDSVRFPGKPLVDIRQHRLELGHIEARASSPVHTKAAANDLAAKGKPLEIQKPCSALQIGQTVGRQIAQAFELVAARQAPAQHVEEIGVVLLQHAKERRDIAGDIVDHLGPGPRRSTQEYPAHADEGLGIAVMLGAIDERADPPREIALAALVSGGGRD